MVILLRSDFLAFSPLTAATVPALEPGAPRELNRQAVDALPGTQRISLTVSRDVVDRLQHLPGAPQEADAFQLFLNENAQRAVIHVINSGSAASIIKGAAARARSQRDMVDIALSLPAQFIARLGAFAMKRGISLHEFLAGALITHIEATHNTTFS